MKRQVLISVVLLLGVTISTMLKTNSHQKKDKLKTGINEYVGPVLKQLIEAKNQEDSLYARREIEEICYLVEKTKAFLENREKWDSELLGHFERIERQIDYAKENKGEDSKKKINDRNWVLLKEKLRKLLENQSVNLFTVSTKEASDLTPKSATSEVGESSNSSNPDDNFELDEYTNQLNPQQMDCLYSLGIYPKDAKLKKRLLLYWWIGLGLVALGENKNTTTEQLAETFFSDLLKKGILQPVHTRRHNQTVNWCIINPTIHNHLTSTCKSKRLLTDLKSEEGTLHFYCNDRSNVRALLNLNQQYLISEDIITKKVMSDHHSMEVVQFGNWHSEIKVHNVDERSTIVSKETKLTEHIEVDKIDFFKKLGERVTFLSLRGISGIERLPDSIGKLEHLRILDLRACHNLEKLPPKRHSKLHKILRLEFRQQKLFKNLTCLDISECFLLDHMPKWVCGLSNLEVLKGFVAGTAGKEKQFCRLSDLSKLKKLRKISIKILTHLNPEDFSGLKHLDSLSVLTLTWGTNEQSRGKEIITGEAENQSRCSVRTPEGKETSRQNIGNGKVPTILFPKNLEKLDIRCYPEVEAPELLNPLEKLKRLYIRGGKLTKIGNNTGWIVEILRLRHLKYLEFNWYHLSSIFTKLKCVEYEQCTKLKYFPRKLSQWSIETNGPFPNASDEPSLELSIDRRIKLTVIRNKKVPLVENKPKMMLELIGWNSISDRPGLDLVAALDVSYNMIRNNKMELLKTAMLFVIKKLTSIDRLSIVTFSSEAKMLSPLLQITESSQKELEDLVNSLKAHGSTNIVDGLQMGLNIIKDCNNSNGRVTSIILLSSGEQTEGGDAADIVVNNVAVHTFGLGYDHDPRVLKAIAYNSMGGTFSDVGNRKNLTKAFSVCLAGLLTVAVQDLTLTISPIKEESTVEQVFAGGYQQSRNKADGSITVRFGNLYSSEVHKVLVDLRLPTTEKDQECDSKVLKISYSYTALEKLFEAQPAIITLSRIAEMSTDQHQVRPEVTSEVNRQKIVELIREATTLADNDQLESARRKIMDAQNILQDLVNKEPEFNVLFKLMWPELIELLNKMGTGYTYVDVGQPFAYSFLTSHDRQRTAIRGLKAENTLIFSTPTMVKFLQQAEEFDADAHVL